MIEVKFITRRRHERTKDLLLKLNTYISKILIVIEMKDKVINVTINKVLNGLYLSSHLKGKIDGLFTFPFLQIS